MQRSAEKVLVLHARSLPFILQASESNGSDRQRNDLLSLDFGCITQALEVFYVGVLRQALAGDLKVI